MRLLLTRFTSILHIPKRFIVACSRGLFRCCCCVDCPLEKIFDSEFQATKHSYFEILFEVISGVATIVIRKMDNKWKQDKLKRRKKKNM